jgi:hypothetical protein
MVIFEIDTAEINLSPSTAKSFFFVTLSKSNAAIANYYYDSSCNTKIQFVNANF